MQNKRKGIVGLSIKHVLCKNWWLFALLLAAIAASISLQLIPAFVLRKIIDDNFVNGILEGVWKLAAFYLLATAGTNIVEFIKIVITTVLGQQILVQLRLLMAKRLSELSMQYYFKTPTGEIMSRLTTDVDAINSLFSAGIVSMIADLFKIIGLLASLFLLAPQLLWLEAAVVPIVYLLANFFRKKIFKAEKQVRACVAAIYTFIQEWLKGIRTVKAYGMEGQGERKFAKPLRAHLAAIDATSLYDSWFPCVMQTLRAVIIALALFLGAKNGTMLSLGLSIGTLAALVDLVGKLFAPLEALATEFQTMQEAMAGLERVREFANQPIEERKKLEQKADKSRGIDITGVNFSYDDGLPILKDITVTISHGQKAIFIGRSGAGKTTLMNIVAGLYACSEGNVRICGVDPYTLPPAQRRRLVGIVPQMPQIFDGTVFDNITLRDDTISEQEVVSAAKTVGLHDVIMQLSLQYQTVIGEGAAGLSSGEIQLLSLARAIAANPDILLLDEPTSGLDTKTEQILFEAVRQAGRGRTILSISHRVSGIIDADTIFVMAEGRVVESGTAQQLRDKDGWYRMYQRLEDARWSVQS